MISIYIKAVVNNYRDFKIDSEIKKYGKFDDAVFEYKKKEKTWIRLFQIKHVEDETKTISYKTDLIEPFKDIQSKFRLITYFKSFLDIKQNVGTDKIKNITIFTNLCLGEDIPENLLQEIDEHDHILDILLPDDKTKPKIVLSTEHENILLDNNNINTVTDNNFTNTQKTPKKLKLFLEESGDLFKAFHKVISQVISEQKEDNKWDPAKVITEFCSKFILAVGQPNDTEMNDVLKNEFYKISGLPISALVDSVVMNIFLDWLNNKYSTDLYLTHKDTSVIIPLIKIKVENLITNYHYQNILNIKDIKYNNTADDLAIIRVSDYFEEKNNPNEKYLIILTKFPLLTLAKIFQCLFCETDKNNNSECLTIESSEILFKKSLCYIKYFKFCIIVLNTKMELKIQEKILKLAKKQKTKIVIVTTKSINWQIEIKDERLAFTKLTPDSQNLILNRKLKFDGTSVRLKDVVSIEYLNELTDADWMPKLILGKLILKTRNIPVTKRNYIERRMGNNLKILSEDEIVDMIKERIIILSADPGMGKTTLLPSIYHKIKKKNFICWIEIIKLTDHDEAFNACHNKINDFIAFMSQYILKHKNSFERELFKYRIENGKNIVIMFDGFDEISPENREIVIKIINNLLKTKIQQIWITTRPTVKDILEKQFSEFSTFSLKLNKFTYDNQITFLKNYWIKSKKKEDTDDDDDDYGNNEYDTEPDNSDPHQNLADGVIRLLNCNDIDIGIPHHTEMAAEYFQTYHLNPEEKLPNKFSKILFFNEFFRNKYKVYREIKIGSNLKTHSAKLEHERLIKEYDNIHQQLAMQHLCSKYSRLLKNNKLTDVKMTGYIVNSIGIAKVDERDNKIQGFVHQTFAEYFVAQYIYTILLDKNTEADYTFFDFVVEIAINTEWELAFYETRIFLSKFLEGVKLPENNLQKLSDRLLNHFEKQTSYDYNSIGNEYFRFKWFYEVFKVFTHENLLKYKNYFPGSYIFIYSKLIDEPGSHNFSTLLIAVFELDAVYILEKFLKSIEMKFKTKDAIKKFFTTSHSVIYPTFLFCAKQNCTEFFLNYLQEIITPIEAFESHLLIKISEGDLFIRYCPQISFKWLKEHMSEIFYKHFLENCKPFLLYTKFENKFLFIYLEMINSKMDIPILKEEMLLHAIKRHFTNAVEAILKNLLNCKKEKLDWNKILNWAAQRGNTEILLKLLEFYKKKNSKKVIKSLTSWLPFDELEMLLSGNIDECSDKLQNHIRTIGYIEILLRVFSKKMTRNLRDLFLSWIQKSEKCFDSKTFNDYFKSEYTKICKYSDNELNATLNTLHCQSHENLNNMIFRVERSLGKKYVLQIINLLVDEQYSSYIYEKPVLADCWYELFKKIISKTNTCENIFSDNFSDSTPLILEEIFKKYSEVIKDNLIKKGREYLRKVLKLDSVDFLKKFLNDLEIQLVTNEQLKDFLTSTDCVIYPTILFCVKENCNDFFLNYLKRKIQPIEEFKTFIETTYYRDKDLFLQVCPEYIMKWIQNNTDDEFYKLFLQSSKNTLIFNKYEDKFISIYNEIGNSCDDLEFCQHMMLHAKSNNFARAIEEIQKNIN